MRTVALLTAAALLVASPAAAQERSGEAPQSATSGADHDGPRRVPEPATRRLRVGTDVHWFEGTVGLASMLTIGIFTTALGSLTRAHWVGALPLDQETREVAPTRDRAAREAIADGSNVLLIGIMALPVVVDVIGDALLARNDPDLALQLALIDALAYSFTLALTGVVKGVASRARPETLSCTGEECREGNDAFFSGHTSMSFTAAGLVCAHHEGLALFEDTAADAGICVGAMAVAAAVGAMRIASDRHWLSDVMVGAAVGVFSGWVLPRLFHIRRRHIRRPERGDEREPSETSALVVPMVAPRRDGATASVLGIF